MKKITLLLMLVITTASFAQLKKLEKTADTSVEIGKVQPLGQPVQIDCYKDGNVYTFNYSDVAFKQLTQYRKFSFEDIDSTFETLYSTIIAGYDAKKEDSIDLELPEYFLTLKFEKSFGMLLLRIRSLDRKGAGQITESNLFTKKQIEKLFGKKK